MSKYISLLLIAIPTYILGQSPSCFGCAGSNMIYEVESGEFHYSFLVSVNEKSSEMISFDWLMTIQEDNQGSLTMTKEAITSADKLFSFYEKGSEAQVSDATALWLSQKTFHALKTGELVKLNPGHADIVFKRDDSYEGKRRLKALAKKYKLNPDVQTILAQAKGEKYILFLDDPSNPLILEMSVGFKLTLEGFF